MERWKDTGLEGWRDGKKEREIGVSQKMCNIPRRKEKVKDRMIL